MTIVRPYNIQMHTRSFLLLFCMIPFFVFPQSKTKSIHADTVVKTDMIGILKGWLHIDFNKGPERPGKKVYYSFLPVSSQVPGAGITLVTSTTAGFFLGDRENTSLSTITFSPYFTLKGSFGY